MTKMCKVCGYTTENNEIKECPNCGSYSLITVNDKKIPTDRFRRF